uniref:Uncharacterized protein n=1 Tax=Plectus sambesii TaxID=2011161 RepID=A0A914VG49_9BILA
MVRVHIVCSELRHDAGYDRCIEVVARAAIQLSYINKASLLNALVIFVENSSQAQHPGPRVRICQLIKNLIGNAVDCSNPD